MLSQHLADRIGWVELVDWIAQAFQQLDPEDQRRCAILCGNYGEAGALNFFGTNKGLPRAISGHNQYFLWGPGDTDGSVMLIYSRAFDRQRLEALFESVEEVGRFEHSMVMPEQNGRTLYLCRGLRKSMEEFFKTTRQFI